MLNENFHYGEPSEINNNLNLHTIANPSFKMKLDDILEGIKNLKQSYNIPEELRIAIKILKRMKLTECAKWNSEVLTSSQNINFNIFNPTNSDKNKFEGTPLRQDTHNITLKNLNLIFNKPENFNFSSLLNSDKDNSNSKFQNEPSEFINKSPGFTTDKFQSDETQNKKFTIPVNKFLNFYKKLKYDESAINDIINYALSLFELKEFSKCSFVLKQYALPKFSTAMFIYYYCEYMLISQRQQEELIENSDLGSKHYSTSEMTKLYQQISSYEERNELSPFMLYLFSLILKSLNMHERARTVLVKCLNEFPFLWSAWVELATITKLNDIRSIFSELDDHWMKYFYLANFLMERNYEQESILICNNLLIHFPNCIFLLNTIAHSYYLMHEYETSQEFFEKLFFNDPMRYENMDTYSNILFIKENFCDLSNLAFKCFQNDKYRPETCCVIGNYYGLKGDHAKSVVYFKRAIKLDYNFLPAWTLMGHEYLEMKNIPAAIESYRTAVDIDPNDYRAWYGLGQTYEIHQMYNYAIYYYLKSAQAKPNDSRMWTALGSCYEKLEKKQEAIKCYEKALFCKDKEGIALFKMAKLYIQLGEESKAAECYRENLKTNFSISLEVDNTEVVESLLFLARYHKRQGDYEEAYNYLLRLKDHEGLEKDEIHSMMREITNLRGHLNRVSNKSNF